MNISSLHLWAPGFTEFGGGITAFSRELASALKPDIHDLRLFGKKDHSGVWSGIPLQGTGGVPGRLQSPAFAGKLILNGWVEPPQLVVSTHLNFGPAAALLKKHRNTPYILVAHGVDVHPNLSKSRLSAIRQADCILAVSEWTRQKVIALGGVDSDRIGVLPNTYDEDRFTPKAKSEELLQRYDINESDQVVLTVARIEKAEGYKGHDLVMKAVSTLLSSGQSVKLIVVGKGNDKERLVQMADDLGIRASVSFTGFVPDEELAAHYQLADVFAMPSSGEGFGIVFLESMGCGTPVLAGNRDGSVDALDGGRLGVLVDPSSADEITRGLNQLLQNEGPKLWSNREELSSEVRQTFGRTAFRDRLNSHLSQLSINPAV